MATVVVKWLRIARVLAWSSQHKQLPIVAPGTCPERMEPECLSRSGWPSQAEKLQRIGCEFEASQAAFQADVKARPCVTWQIGPSWFQHFGDLCSSPDPETLGTNNASYSTSFNYLVVSCVSTDLWTSVFVDLQNASTFFPCKYGTPDKPNLQWPYLDDHHTIPWPLSAVKYHRPIWQTSVMIFGSFRCVTQQRFAPRHLSLLVGFPVFFLEPIGPWAMNS